jgi:DNA-binding MarR family transcriptional regulator
MTDTHDSSPLRLIGRITRGFTRIADGGLREFGFAVGQLPVLVSLKKRKALSQAELARIAQVEQPSMAQLLARMERDGLVERVPDPNDGRSRLISLTGDCMSRMHEARAVMQGLGKQALEGFSAQDQADLDRLMRQLAANVDRLLAERGE